MMEIAFHFVLTVSVVPILFEIVSKEFDGRTKTGLKQRDLHPKTS